MRVRVVLARLYTRVCVCVCRHHNIITVVQLNIIYIEFLFQCAESMTCVTVRLMLAYCQENHHRRVLA